MAATEVDIMADEIEEKKHDQTGQNSARQVSNSEIPFKPFVILKFRKAFKIERNLLDNPPKLNSH